MEAKICIKVMTIQISILIDKINAGGMKYSCRTHGIIRWYLGVTFSGNF
jgi:hypothetical protein